MNLELVEGAIRLPNPAGAFPARKVRTPSEQEALDFIAKAVHGMQADVTDYMAALVNKHSRQDYDFKEIVRRLDAQGGILKDIARRVRVLEGQEKPQRKSCRLPLKPEARSNSPRPGVEGDRREIRNELERYENRPLPPVNPVPDYAALRKEAAKKAERELPETVSTKELARYFGLSHNKVWTLATHGEIPVVRKGRLMFFPRAEVVAYIRSRGVPKRKALHYGVSGIREVPAKEGHGDAWLPPS